MAGGNSNRIEGGLTHLLRPGGIILEPATTFRTTFSIARKRSGVDELKFTQMSVQHIRETSPLHRDNDSEFTSVHVETV